MRKNKTTDIVGKFLYYADKKYKINSYQKIDGKRIFQLTNTENNETTYYSYRHIHRILFNGSAIIRIKNK